MTYQIINGNSALILKTYPDNYFDAVVTDPPYGINFLGKDWDSNTGEEEVYRECLRVLKPGGHILAFSAARTYHHLAMTIERVGFEVRDQIMWVYGSGFPKSQDVGKSIARREKKVKNTKTYLPEIDDNRNVANSTTGSPRCQMCDKSTGPIWKKCPDDRADCIKPWEADLQDNEWNGWGTALKPAHEPICLARKPVKQSIAKNVQEWGTGALNIDACRVSTTPDDVFGGGAKASSGVFVQGYEHDGFVEGSSLGRFPANFIHDGSDEVVAMFPDSNGSGGSVPKVKTSGYGKFGGGKTEYTPDQRTPHNSGSGSAARFFYCAKVSRSERHLGFDQVQGPVGNNHPTVKPIALMEYLIKLVTPPGGHILDPFNGSGSTGCAAVGLGYDYTGIELDPHYVEITNNRIAAWLKQQQPQELPDPLADHPLFEVAA